MFLRLIETLGILYCICSYAGCLYIYLTSFKNEDVWGDLTTNEKIIAGIIFILFAPFVVGYAFGHCLGLFILDDSDNEEE